MAKGGGVTMVEVMLKLWEERGGGGDNCGSSVYRTHFYVSRLICDVLSGTFLLFFN